MSYSISGNRNRNREITLASSDGVIDCGGFCRWGDHAGASPDPTNPHVVWGANQANRLSQIDWKTQNFALQVAPSERQPITVTAVSNSKVYDGTKSASATPVITTGSLFPGDTAVFTETYDNLAAGTGKTLTPSGTVNDGNGGNNYTIHFVPDSTGVVTPAPLAVTANNQSRSSGRPTPRTSSVISGRQWRELGHDWFD